MNVFLSWSGKRSHMMASALRQWLPKVLSAAEPWLSSKDIDAGRLWADELFEELKDADLCIMCLTKDRLISKWSQWMLFEAGSMATATNKPIVIPYCLDFPTDQLSEGPLSLFQAKKANKAGTYDMLETLNKIVKECELDTLRQKFDTQWPVLARALESIPPDSSETVIVTDVLCAFSQAFESEGVEHDIAALKKNFPDRVTLIRRATHVGFADVLARPKKKGAKKRFNIVHIIAAADAKGRLVLDDEIAGEDLDFLLDGCATELVFLATCHTIALGERLARKRSVITGYGESKPENWGSWIARFYDYLASGQSLFEAYDNAKAVYHLPIILLPKRNCRFVIPRKMSRRSDNDSLFNKLS
jgi:TIR domain